MQKEIDKCTLDISGNFIAILEQLYKIDLFITIHCENESEKCQFFMGKIKNISEEIVEFYSLDTDGEWENKTDIIYFSDITMITVGDHYSKMFYKYIEQG